MVQSCSGQKLFGAYVNCNMYRRLKIKLVLSCLFSYQYCIFNRLAKNKWGAIIYNMREVRIDGSFARVTSPFCFD